MTIEELHRRHSRVLYALAVRVLADHGEAEDALQEVFLRAHRRLVWFIGSDHFAWLYRITLNVSIEMLRARRRRAIPTDPQEFECRADGVPLVSLEYRQELERLLESLDERDLAIVIAHYVHGLGQEDVAKQLGVSRRAVVKRLTRIRAAAELRPALVRDV